MATHARHVFGASSSERITVKFPRDDFLWDGGEISSPHDGEVITVPIEHKHHLIGPTILDMMTRKVVRWRNLPPSVRPEDADPEEYTAVWRFRDPDTLWPAPGQSQRRQQTPREPSMENNRDGRAPAHPFFLELASGGVPVGGAPHGFVRVRKQTTVTLAEGAYRLAVAMQGGVAEANHWISEIGRVAWERDINRSLELWTAISANGGQLIEDDYIVSLRPKSSISQEVERQITRETIRWLGVDPDAELVRPRGRPKAAPGDEGDILRMNIGSDGTVVGTFKAPYLHILQGVSLSRLDMLTLVEILGALRADGHGKDADLLEAYLDVAASDWREQASGAVDGGSSVEESPYDTLGVTPDTSMDQVSAAFRAVMLAVQHLPNPSAIQRRLTTAYKTIKTSKKETA